MGKNISANIKKSIKEKVTTNHDLESKIWYRLSKIIYIGFYIFFILSFLIPSYYSKPKIITEKDKVKIKCNNGNEFIKTIYSPINSIEDIETLDSHVFNPIRLCQYGDETTSYYLWDKYPTSSEKNYTIEFVTHLNKSWQDYLTNRVIVLTMIIVTFEIVRRSFLYIVARKRFFS